MDQHHSTTLITDRKRGKHLEFEDRCAIRIFNKLGYSLRQIATAINCSHSTIFNELKRGTATKKGSRGRNPEYSPKRGQNHYLLNRANSHRKYKLSQENPCIKWMITTMKIKKWSFDACVGFAKRHKLFPLEQIPCTKTLYNALWDNRLPISPFDVPEALSRKKRKASKSVNRKVLGTSIDALSEVVSLRIKCGHCEIDTVIGRKVVNESVVLTLVEKKTNFYIAIKIPNKTADAVYCALETLREEYGKTFF